MTEITQGETIAQVFVVPSTRPVYDFHVLEPRSALEFFFLGKNCFTEVSMFLLYPFNPGPVCVSMIQELGFDSVLWPGSQCAILFIINLLIIH